MMNDPEPSRPKEPRRLIRFARSVLLNGVLPIVVLVAAGVGAKQMIDTAPKAPRRPPVRQAKLVEIQEVRAVPRSAVIEAMGTVRPARQIELKPQVSGRVEWVAEDLLPGGRFEAGEPLVRIERKDYELAVAQRESAVRIAEAAVVEARRGLTDAEKDLRIEMGNQEVARREYEVLEEHVTEENQDLVLRRPQLEAARAEVEAASAAVASASAALEAERSRLENAQLDLQRTTVAAPFNVVVDEKLVDEGDAVSTNTPLVRLIGSDEFWLELAIPQSDLKWIDVPQKPGDPGSEVRIRDKTAWTDTVCRTGRVIRCLPSVEEQGRMARILVSINDPLALEAEDPGFPPLFVGSYPRAEILGRAFDSVVAIPRHLVRNGDEVWLMNDDHLLEIRRIDVIYRSRDEVLVQSGLEPGDRVVVTELSAPVEGMPLRTREREPDRQQTALDVSSSGNGRGNR